MKKTRVLCLVLILMMILGIIGCQTVKTTKPEESDTGIKSDTGINAGEQLTVMVGKGVSIDDYETNKYILWLEEETGVKPIWEQIPASSMIDKLPIVMMSGNLPDILLGCNIQDSLSATRQAQYGSSEKLLLPLNDLIESYGSETKRMFSEQPGTKELITMSDGNIYALPTYSDIIHVNYAQKLQINTTFLKVLKMEMPTTTEELYDYLKAVKEKDPNGNGKDDEIPLIGCIDGWHMDVFPWLTEMFIFDDGMYGKKVDVDANGKVFSILDQPGYRDALTYIKKLYSEGLLYEGSLTMKLDQAKQLGENPEAMIVGAVFACDNKSIASLSGDRYKQYSACAPVTGPSDLRQTPWFRYANVRVGAFAITKTCKDPETAMKFGDFMYSYDATMRLRMGEKDIDWRDANEGETTIDGRPAMWLRISPFTGEAQNQHLGNDGMFYETRGMFLDDCAVDKDFDITSPEGDQFMIAKETTGKYVPYGKEVFPPVIIPSDLIDEYATIETELKTYYQTARAEFVTGVKSIDSDSDWDSYVDDLKVIGLDRYTEILQVAYDKSPVKVGQ